LTKKADAIAITTSALTSVDHHVQSIPLLCRHEFKVIQAFASDRLLVTTTPAAIIPTASTGLSEKGDSSILYRV